MTKKIKVKTFILALNTFGPNLRKAKTFLKDKRLTQAEKTIIQCYFFLRNNRIKEVIKALENLVTNDFLVESQRMLYLGYAYNNQSDFAQAVPLMEKALELMHGHGLIRQEFIALNNLFVVYRNLKNLKAMRHTLERMHELGACDQSAEICLLHNDLKYASVSGNYPEAEAHIQKLERLKKEMNEAQIISYLVDKFDFCIKTDQFDECHEILNETKSYRKFHLSANFNFMKLLLSHYTDNKTLYVTDSDFAHFSMLFNQIKVIQKLEEGDVGSASEFWKKLSNLYPQTYGVEFADYRGDKCLFSVCLSKHQKVSNVIELKKSELPKSKQAALLKILSEAVAPVHQEVIYELIWEEVPESKNDLNKLARLVSIVREKTGLDIKTKKSCYYLEKAVKKVPKTHLS